MATCNRIVPIVCNWQADKACAENGGGAERCINDMDKIAGPAERLGPEYADVEGEDRGADNGNSNSPSDLADEQSLLMC